jgi:hypothetical protein
VVNFTFVPAQHRILFHQSVGMGGWSRSRISHLEHPPLKRAGWNTFLSWSNNVNNRRLAEATTALAEVPVMSRLPEGVDGTDVTLAVAMAGDPKAKVGSTRAEGSPTFNSTNLAQSKKVALQDARGNR